MHRRLLLGLAVLPTVLGAWVGGSSHVPGGCRVHCSHTPLRASLVAAEGAAAQPPPVAAGTPTLPPESFLTIVEQAAEAVDLAVSDGHLLLEIEFPPIPISKLEDSSLSAYDILAQNLQLAVEFAKRLKLDADTQAPRKIALTLPDSAERQRAAKYYGDDEPWPGMSLWSLNGGDESGEEFSPMAFFGSIFKQGKGEVVAQEGANMHLIVGASAQELPAIQELADLTPGKPIVCFNLKLDTLRGDLGLPAFPPKDVHHEFLCKVKPVYYLRQRSYSLSLSVPPFLIAYGGVLFRRYPEGYQSLLDKGKGTYRRVEYRTERPPLGTFKADLTAALKLSDEKAASTAISQAGYKQSTWWEDDKDGRDVSREWRL